MASNLADNAHPKLKRREKKKEEWNKGLRALKWYYCIVALHIILRLLRRYSINRKQ